MIFVDTGAWVARFSSRDQYHDEATRIWARLKDSGERIMTSDSVFVETVSFLARKISPEAAAEAGRFMQGWQALRIVRIAEEEETVALTLLEKFADQPIGFVDCLSFALMRREAVRSAFTFDRHFEMAGFSIFGREA